MASQQVVPTASAPPSRPPSIALTQTPTPAVLASNSESVIMPSGAQFQLSPPVANRSSISMSVNEDCCSNASVKCESILQDGSSAVSIAGFLARYVFTMFIKIQRFIFATL